MLHLNSFCKFLQCHILEEDGAEADVDDDGVAAAMDDEEDDEAGKDSDNDKDAAGNNRGTKAKAHAALCKKIQEFRKKCTESGKMDKQTIVNMMKTHFSKSQ